MLGPPKPRRLDEPIAVSLEALVPQFNFYGHLATRLDLSFVRDWTRELYAEQSDPLRKMSRQERRRLEWEATERFVSKRAPLLGVAERSSGNESISAAHRHQKPRAWVMRPEGWRGSPRRRRRTRFDIYPTPATAQVSTVRPWLAQRSVPPLLYRITRPHR